MLFLKSSTSTGSFSNSTGSLGEEEEAEEEEFRLGREGKGRACQSAGGWAKQKQQQQHRNSCPGGFADPMEDGSTERVVIKLGSSCTTQVRELRELANF